MGFFRVDPHHLEALAHRLDDGVSHLQAAARELARMGPSGLGTESLDAACHELQQEWDGGTERIAALSAELAEGLRDTARTYRASDSGSAAERLGVADEGGAAAGMLRLYERLGGSPPAGGRSP